MTDKFGEYLSVYVWLTNVNEGVGTHVLHIAIDGMELVTYRHDASFATGTNIRALFRPQELYPKGSRI